MRGPLTILPSLFGLIFVACDVGTYASLDEIPPPPAAQHSFGMGLGVPPGGSYFLSNHAAASVRRFVAQRGDKLRVRSIFVEPNNLILSVQGPTRPEVFERYELPLGGALQGPMAEPSTEPSSASAVFDPLRAPLGDIVRLRREALRLLQTDRGILKSIRATIAPSDLITISLVIESAGAEHTVMFDPDGAIIDHPPPRPLKPRK